MTVLTPETSSTPDQLPPRPKQSLSLTFARILGGIGRTLIGSGLIILLFVAYQLWGTGIQEQRAQNEGEDEFASLVDDFSDIVGDADGGIDFDKLMLAEAADPGLATDSTEATAEEIETAGEDPNAEATTGDVEAAEAAPETTTAPTTALPVAAIEPEIVNLLFPETGEPMAQIEIPKIGVKKIVYEGVETEDLKKGPGHYPNNPLPGQPGNAAIAGHRTTYGAPFGDLDQLAIGDDIFVKTVLGTAHYRVEEAPFIVEPTAVEVLNDFGDNRITLTACHPKYSARQRLIATAVLVSEPFPIVAKPDVNPVAIALDTPPTTSAPATTVPPVEEAAAAPATTISTETTTEALADETPADDATATQTPSADTAVQTTSLAENPNDLANTISADQTEEANLDGGLGWDTTALQPAILWGLGFLLIGAIAWMVGWRRWINKWAAYTLAFPVAGYLLWNCFFYVDRFLPAY